MFKAVKNKIQKFFKDFKNDFECRTLGQKIYTTILLIVGIFCLVYGLLYNTFDYSRVNFYYVMSSIGDQGYYLILGVTFIIKFFYDFDN